MLDGTALQLMPDSVHVPAEEEILQVFSQHCVPEQWDEDRTPLSRSYQCSPILDLPPAQAHRLEDNYPVSRKEEYWWFEAIPTRLRTRHQYILEYLQVTAGAQCHGVKQTIHKQKWRYGGSPEQMSLDLLEHYRNEAKQGTLSESAFQYLVARGYASESYLYDRQDTEPLAPTETNGRQFFNYLSFDGSDPKDFINEANAVRSNRRTYKSEISRPDVLDHLRGFNITGPVRDKQGYYRFIALDIDRHAWSDPQEFTEYILTLYGFVKRRLADCAIVVQVNPKNGSTVFFCYFAQRRTFGEVECLVNNLDAQAKKEVPGYTTPEIYPVLGPGKVFLPFNPVKTTIGDTGLWPKFKTKRTKTCNRMEVCSLANFPEYVRCKKKADAETLRQVVTDACRQPIREAKKVRETKHGQKSQAGTGGMGMVPKFRGCFLRVMVDFFQGRHQAEPDTIGKYLTPMIRTIAHIEECWDADELKERTQRLISLIPDTSFSDRLSNDPGELERSLDYTISAVVNGNGYQPRPEESTAIFGNLKRYCNRIGFVPSDPATWGTIDNREFQPSAELVWTPKLAEFMRGIASVLNSTPSQAKELLQLVFNWIETRSEMAYSICKSLMNKVGIKAYDDKARNFIHALKEHGFISKQKNYGHYRDFDGQFRNHGNFYMNTAEIVFREQLPGASDQPDQGAWDVYLLYLSFLSSDCCEYLMEQRRLTVNERYQKRRKERYGHLWKTAA